MAEDGSDAEAMDLAEATQQAELAVASDEEAQQGEIWIRDKVLDLDSAEPVRPGQRSSAAPTTMHARLAELREAPRVFNRANGSGGPNAGNPNVSGPNGINSAALGVLTPPGGTFDRANGTSPSFTDHQRMPAPRARRERPQSGSGLLPRCRRPTAWACGSGTRPIAP